jgi:uncharacterized protein (TIGR02722 family)
VLSRSVPLLAALAALSVGCATGSSPTVQRLDANTVTDLSGRWNDTDSRLVAEEMIQDSLSRPWLATAQQRKGAPPTVIVQQVRNNSSEHIHTDTFVEDLQRALINSGRVQFVANAEERQGLRQERLDQDVNAADATRKAHGQETGADFALSGTISSIVDRDGGAAVILYQVNLKLLDLQTNQIVWNGQKKIKKAVSRSSVGL